MILTSYYPQIWRKFKSSCLDQNQNDPIDEVNQEPFTQTTEVDAKRKNEKRQSKKKNHKRLYKTLGLLVMIAMFGSVIANMVYFIYSYNHYDLDHDKCYFNEKCLVPKQWNKIFSNMQYILYGIALILAPTLNQWKLSIEQVSSAMGLLLVRINLEKY